MKGDAAVNAAGAEEGASAIFPALEVLKPGIIAVELNPVGSMRPRCHCGATHPVESSTRIGTIPILRLPS